VTYLSGGGPRFVTEEG